MKKSLYVVLGMHRSGTSVITRALVSLGVDVGTNLWPAGSDNVKGFWEDSDIIGLNEDMLAICGQKWDSIEPITQSNIDFLSRSTYADRALDLVNQKLADCLHFGIKDPRISKLLGFWEGIFDKIDCSLHYIIALRNPKCVAHSLYNRNAIDHHIGYLLWISHILSICDIVIDHSATIVSYDDLMESPREKLSALSKNFGISRDVESINDFADDFLDKDLQHTRFSLNDLKSDCSAPSLVIEMYSFLHGLRPENMPIMKIQITELLENWQFEFQRLLSAYELVKISKKEAEEARLDAEKARLDAEKARLDAEKARLDAEKARLDAETARTEASLAIESLMRLRSSLTWKITEPLRQLLRSARRFLRKSPNGAS